MEYYLQIDGRPFDVYFLTLVEAKRAAAAFLANGRNVTLLENPGAGGGVKEYEPPEETAHRKQEPLNGIG